MLVFKTIKYLIWSQSTLLSWRFVKSLLCVLVSKSLRIKEVYFETGLGPEVLVNQETDTGVSLKPTSSGPDWAAWWDPGSVK
jgi:hypothetical protein